MKARADAAGTVRIGGDLKVHRLGFGAMRITGADIWGPPRDPAEARRRSQNALRRYDEEYAWSRSAARYAAILERWRPA